MEFGGLLRSLGNGELIKSFRVFEIKIWLHYVFYSDLITLNLNFVVNWSICGILRFIKIIREWGAY